MVLMFENILYHSLFYIPTCNLTWQFFRIRKSAIPIFVKIPSFRDLLRCASSSLVVSRRMPLYRLSFGALCDTFRNKVTFGPLLRPLLSQQTPLHVRSSLRMRAAFFQSAFIYSLFIYTFIYYLSAFFSVFCAVFLLCDWQFPLPSFWCRSRCCGAFSIAFFVILISQLPYLCKSFEAPSLGFCYSCMFFTFCAQPGQVRFQCQRWALDCWVSFDRWGKYDLYWWKN